MKLKESLALGILCLPMFQMAALADDTSDAIADLKKQIQALSENVQALENQQTQRHAVSQTQPQADTTSSSAKTESAKPKAPAFVTAGDEGFSIRSADTNFVLRLRAYGHFDSHFYASPALGAHDTLTLRRMRLAAEGTVYKYYDYRLLIDVGSGITATSTNNAFLQDAHVNFNYWPGLQLQAGKFKEPVSLDVLQSDANMEFIERGLPSELAPNRDAGAMLHGDLFNNTLSYSAGIFNGVPDYGLGSGDVDVSDNYKDFSGRLFAQPFKNTSIQQLKGLGFGVGSSYGNQIGAVASYVTTARQKFFSYASGDGTTAAKANVTASGPHLRLAPQGYWYWGPFGVFGEYDLSSERLRRDAGLKPTYQTFDNQGWNVAFTYFLTGEKNQFDPVTIVHPFRPDGKSWGAWEVVGRYGVLDLDPKAFPSWVAKGSAEKATSWSAGLNWYFNKNVKLNLEYEQTAFGGASLGAPGTVVGQDEKAMLTRIQFQF